MDFKLRQSPRSDPAKVLVAGDIYLGQTKYQENSTFGMFLFV